MEAEIDINGSKEAVWKVVTDIDNAANTMQAIEAIEVLERPAEGLVGLKWKETRTMFGRTASEVMWISEASPPNSYKVRAEGSGVAYETTFDLSEHNGHTHLRMNFDGQPQSFGAKVMGAIGNLFFKGATQKALMQDLEDIKAKVEAT